MSDNRHAFYWMQFSFRTSSDGYVDRSAEARALRQEEPHDASTRKMIEQYDKVWQLAEADTVVPLIERWWWLERMGSPEEKQALIEPLIQRVQRSPEDHQGELIFILLALEPLRRSIAKKFLAGVALGSFATPAVDRHRRHEARWLQDMEREDLFNHTRWATLEVIHGYKFNLQPGRFFAWFRETLSWRVLDIYKQEYLGNGGLPASQMEALQSFLHGFDAIGGPELGEPGGFYRWRQRLGGLRPLYAAVNGYHDSPQVRRVCQSALGRLACRQRETIEAYFYENLSLKEIAEQRGAAVSTIGNTKAKAEDKLRADDLFYFALDSLGRVRNDVRRREIEQRHPDGLLPDGRRIVWVGE